MAHQAGAYPGFCSIKGSGIFLLPLDGMPVYRRVNPGIKFAGINLYNRVERGTVRVKYLFQDSTQCPQPGFEPGPLDPESSALSVMPPRLH